MLDEVVRFKKTFLNSSSDVDVKETGKEKVKEEVVDSGYSSASSVDTDSSSSSSKESSEGTLKRKTLAGMLSEALCSRARRVSERKSPSLPPSSSEEDEVPFARRAREAGKRFSGGKNDDISVVVAVISPKQK